MEKIVLENIEVNQNIVKYCFAVSDGLSQYFSGKPLVIEYPMELISVPKSILAVPFVCNVLPIIWLTDSKLILQELDKDFFECIPNVKKGYETMFPESIFGGEIVVDRIEVCGQSAKNGCAALFSGGLDATQTLVSHLAENPHLISIWGSDIAFGNADGWQVVHQGIADTANRLSLPDVVIRSSFREFDNEGELDWHFSKQLQDGWWHGVKHGLALLGHVAPYAWYEGLARVYIASSNCPADGVVRCASNPTIDNHVRYGGCQVVHDGFEFSRQDKVRNMVEFVEKSGKQVTLHACWQSQSGSNCCRCEKCYRTMAGILAEGAEAEAFGFSHTKKTLPDMRQYIIEQKALNANTAKSYWKHIHDRIIQRRAVLKKKWYWKHIKWIEKADFLNHETIKMPLHYRIRKKLAEFKFYQALHKLKERLK